VSIDPGPVVPRVDPRRADPRRIDPGPRRGRHAARWRSGDGSREIGTGPTVRRDGKLWVVCPTLVDQVRNATAGGRLRDDHSLRVRSAPSISITRLVL